MAQSRCLRCHPRLTLAAIIAALTLAPATGVAAEPEVHEQVAVSAPTPVRAAAADDVVESIGVNTHINYSDTNYNDFSMVRQRLGELGIRYIRDHISLGRPDVYTRMRQLAADGIHLDVIAGDPLQRWQIGTIDQQLDLIQTELPSAVISIEGPNEYDIQGDPNWVPVLRDYTQRLWEGVKARPALAGLPVLSPSIVRRDNMAVAGDLTPWIDYGNTHTYLSGDIPERDSIWNGEFSAAADNSGSKPMQVTETGYHNGVNATAGHQPASEKAAGIYMPRLFLANFQRGIVRSFSYELLDQRDDPAKTDIEAAFGLLRNDFSKKPAAVAIERLIGLLSDPGPRFTPDRLAYRLEDAPAGAEQLLLQKRDGSFYLALWNKVSVWDQGERADTNPADVPVTLQLGQPIARAEVFEPNLGAAATATVSDPASVALDLSERVTVVRLVPPGTAPAPAPDPVPAPPAPEPEPEPAPSPAPEPAPSPQPEPSPEPTPAPEPAPAPDPDPAPAPSPSPAPAPQPAPPPQTSATPPPRSASATALTDAQSASATPPAAATTAPAPAATASRPPASGPINRSHRPWKKARKYHKRHHRAQLGAAFVTSRGLWGFWVF
jgi:hypothetical protein